jgi:nitrate reductase gamma subunit
VTLALYSSLWGALAVFLGASVARALRYARQPLHLRWELYPVPHERPDRVKHGGSYFESSEWWKRPRHFSWTGEVRAMIPEMVFLAGLRQANRSLWYRSFPFHFGLYLMSGSVALLVLGAGIWAGVGRATGLVQALRALAGLAGIAGLALSVVGALGLLHRRLTDAALRNYTTAADVFNLLFFIGALTFLGVGYAQRPASSPGALAVVHGLLTGNSALPVATPFAIGLIVASVLVAYVPLTHMSHFIAKYFTYHAVRWDDAPLRDREAMAARVAHYLAYRPTWSAGHIASNAGQTWAEVASSTPPSEARR